MSILKKFLDLNNFYDKDNFYELVCRNKKVGFVHKLIAEKLIESKIKADIRHQKFIVKGSKLNKEFSKITDILLKKKYIENITEENFPCTDFLGKKEYFNVNRATVEYLGIRGYGVHLTAFTKISNKIYLWTPIRSKYKKVEPNKYDNTVAGGIASGETLKDALFREAKEEANVSKNLIKKANSAGTVSYNWRNKKYTLRRDTLFLYDLEVDRTFKPICLDGELEKFKLIPWTDALKKIKNTNSFKKNCALVVASFLIRKGLLTSENETNYEKICYMINS